MSIHRQAACIFATRLLRDSETHRIDFAEHAEGATIVSLTFDLFPEIGDLQTAYSIVAAAAEIIQIEADLMHGDQRQPGLFDVLDRRPDDTAVSNDPAR